MDYGLKCQTKFKDILGFSNRKKRHQNLGASLNVTGGPLLMFTINDEFKDEDGFFCLTYNGGEKACVSNINPRSSESMVWQDKAKILKFL